LLLDFFAKLGRVLLLLLLVLLLLMPRSNISSPGQPAPLAGSV